MHVDSGMKRGSSSESWGHEKKKKLKLKTSIEERKKKLFFPKYCSRQRIKAYEMKTERYSARPRRIYVNLISLLLEVSSENE